MKAAGYFLLVGGFLLGAYSTALDVRSTLWALFVPAAVLAVVGLLILKRATSGNARSVEVLTANKAELQSSIANVVARLRDIVERRDSLATDAVRTEIDRLLRDDLRRFAEARESMVHLFGIQNYADIMSQFAAGERNINRVWSASTDGYRDEAHRYLDRALGRFTDTKTQLDEAVARG